MKKLILIFAIFVAVTFAEQKTYREYKQLVS
jgi:hypothetical protein